MKLLFMTTDVGFYGSSRSLGTLINCLMRDGYVQSDDLFLFYQLAAIEKRTDFNPDLEQLTNKRGVFLPCSNTFIGGTEGRYNRFILSFRNILSFILWAIQYRRTVFNISPTLIYLNSINLWPMLIILPKNIKIVLHAREILNIEQHRVKSSIATKLINKRCSKVIAVDEKTSKPFKNVAIMHNPFSMQAARELRKNDHRDICLKYDIDPSAINITLIGRIEELRGQHFFLEAINQMKDVDKACFLIVGDGTGKYAEKLKNIGKKYKNVLFLGKIKRIEEIYAVSDVVVRCEESLRFERTFFEAYYSGCRTLLPYAENDDLRELNKYKDDGTQLYKARSIDDFREHLTEMIKSGKVYFETRPNSNAEEYVASWYSEVIENTARSSL